MTIEEWLQRATAEQATTLHRFNYDREQTYGGDTLTTSYAEFEAFLAPWPDDCGDTAHGLLNKFVESRATPERLLEDPPLDPRYSEPGLRHDSRSIFLRNLGMPLQHLQHIGFDVAAIRDVSGAVRDALNSGTAAPEQLQTWVEGLTPPRPTRSRASASPRYGGTRTARGAPAPKATQFGNDPWWFTYEDELTKEETRLKAQGIDRTAPLQRSGYVAGLRAVLGLDHKTDVLPDTTVAGGMTRDGNSAIVFRMAFQLAVTMPGHLSGNLHQPRIFSDGFPHLFLTNPSTASGGMTVRLKDRDCRHDDDLSCLCADDGLPEGVTPSYVVMGPACHREVRGVFLVLHNELSRFSPPSCDEIRARRPPAP